MIKIEKDKKAGDNISEKRIMIGGIDATNLSPEVQAAMRQAMEESEGDELLAEKDDEFKAAKKEAAEANKNDSKSVLGSMSQELGQDIVAEKTDINGNPDANIADQDELKNIKCGK